MQAHIEIITAALPTKRTVAHAHEWNESDGTEKCRKCGAINKGYYTQPLFCWDEHVEVPDEHILLRFDLSHSDLREIGTFTRENVRRWMESHNGVDWIDTLSWGPIHDFHAVRFDHRGLRDVPWAFEKSEDRYGRHRKAINERTHPTDGHIIELDPRASA